MINMLKFKFKFKLMVDIFIGEGKVLPLILKIPVPNADLASAFTDVDLFAYNTLKCLIFLSDVMVERL